MADDDMSEERLEEIEEHIQRARERAEEAGVLPDPDEHRFYESGEESELDDQTIAPPG